MTVMYGCALAQRCPPRTQSRGDWEPACALGACVLVMVLCNTAARLNSDFYLDAMLYGADNEAFKV